MRLAVLSCIVPMLSLLVANTSMAGEEKAAPAAVAEWRAGCDTRLKDARQALVTLETVATPISEASLLQPFNRLLLSVKDTAQAAYLRESVHPDPAMREAAGACYRDASALGTEISLSRPVYERLSQLPLNGLATDARFFVERTLREYRLAGVDRDPETRKRIRALRDELDALGQTFDRNIREQEGFIVLSGVDELAGLPEDYIAAHPPGPDGRIRITTAYPDYMPFMRYAHSDQRRRELYTLFNNRGYPANDAVFRQMLEKRHALARLLGFDSYADLITADKMIGSAARVRTFIDDIARVAQPVAEAEKKRLLTRLQQLYPGAAEVQPWQTAYVTDLLEREHFQVDSREVREYFGYADSRDGIFRLVERLFGVQIRPWQDSQPWHSSVESYEILQGERLLGRFYLDMHPREGKYEHAAQFPISTGIAGVQVPVSALVCNMPGGKNPAERMEHGDVETFLHEFGHLLHEMFGGHQRWVSLSGVATEWDFVEAPSQMLEEWVWDQGTLQTFARNTQGEVMPDALVQRMNRARHFGAGLRARQQMYYAALSLGYHDSAPSALSLLDTMQHAQRKYSPWPYVPGTHFYASFGHLNGYSAMYYTYMWSEVIAADLFSRFRQAGLDSAEVAGEYRDRVLAPGGSRPAEALVRDFLGRPYNATAFEQKLREAAALSR